MTTTELFLIALTIIFAVPYLFWRLLKTDYYAPLVVVQIVGGIILGPGVLGAAYPAYYQTVFAPEVIAALNGIAWWAVMMFVFVAGVELDLSAAWKDRRETTTTAALALFTPLALGALAGMAILAFPGWLGPQGTYVQALLGIGMSCAVTALPILVLLMEKLGIFREPLGQRLLRYASLDDLAIWGVLALILLDWERISRQGAFLLFFAVFAWGMRRLMQRISENDRWYVSLVWLALCGLVADWAGLHYMVGAFLAGCVLDREWFGEKRLDEFRGVVLLCVMPVFFLSTGLRTDFSSGGVAVFAVALLLLAASVAGKLLGVHIAGRILKWQPGEASVIGWLLQTKALIMIIFANVLLDKEIITGQTFTALLLMAVMSTMLTVPVVTPKLKRMLAKD
ncbi:cation:proton antiporter [Alteraurantiacibacter buctensis]|uniref:Cation:proton antiporter n=1 Tax=Alteraurantiacibacter buctensis TaxID=1503981 RepID=A0A844YVN3_9SPHN|nr:cation:proton antiporter [Alteraurantiacibacter buctensis]MXO71202.1 cation:proton antiporter [Alteraurantiacibacter buctensis]